MLKKRTIYIIENKVAGELSSRLSFAMKTVTVKTLTSMAEFLTAYREMTASCLLLGVNEKSQEILDALKQFEAKAIDVPCILYMTESDVTFSVQAIKAGAFDVLLSPDQKTLIDSLEVALSHDASLLDKRSKRKKIKEIMCKLTLRERQVMDGVTCGKPNRTIANELGLAQVTVEFHRSQVMRKMHARSVAELVKMRLFAEEVGVKLLDMESQKETVYM